MAASDLTVRLFLGSVCMFAFALAVNQAGWRHHALIGSLFALSVISGLAAIFYEPMRRDVPTFASSLEGIAGNAWAWFFLFAALSISVLGLTIRDRIQGTLPTVREVRVPHVASPPVVERSADVQVLERIVADVTPEYLLQFYDGRTSMEAHRSLEPYIGKLVTWSGQIDNIGPPGPYHIQVAFDISDKLRLGQSRQVFMYFDLNWLDRLSILKRGDSITGRGVIDRVHSMVIELAQCELVA